MTLAASGLDDLLLIARDTALAAGALALQRKREGVEVAQTKTTPLDIVTHADRETEALIRGLLSDARPDDGFLGEESGGDAGTSGLTWVVDPIDGTVNFLYGIPAWSVSIAVVEGDPDPATWRALAGAVVNPVTGDVFTATAGGGARLGDDLIRVNDDVPFDRALVGTGFAYDVNSRGDQIATVSALLGRVRDVRRMGSAALDLCSVAAGRLDAYYERGLNPWDQAAGALIAKEAGASVVGVGGGPAGKELTLAAAPALAAELLEFVTEFGAPES
ncbi:inositol monophosphatase family protein [Herbiconiux sp. L3-i23]|uniref:inositol monophosphatase family protein n=1 Tax=Herbiconiux sp. L3-i23 TaxID=2905871 RepID=UPI00204E25CA|nr:inositol monophosphatase family protein [Herbiconiux sp. L3-i23]BDI21371.1 inositol monophosphatase [Herbiconiux sp. L3-i23]